MSAPPFDLRNVNTLWAGVLAETLHRAGVARAVVSPGSRSAPLALALAAHHGIESVPVLDERSAAFFALGLARARMRPVALVCTSGTAAANYFPAVIEAHEGGVPLVVITADRPPELRACAAGQAIDQQKLYGAYPGFFHELAPPELSEPRLRYLRQAVAHAVERSLVPSAGPVHLNVPLRDPLAPMDDGGAAAHLARAIDWEAFFGHLAPVEPAPAAGRVPRLEPEAKGVIIVGPTQPEEPGSFATGVGELARRLGWPVLADGASPIRYYAARVPHLVTTYDLLLRNRAVAERLRPEVVVCIGDWPASKVLRAWVEESAPRVWMVAGRPDNRDALHGRAQPIAATLAALVAAQPEGAAAGGRVRDWDRVERRTRAALDRRLRAERRLTEPKVAWLLAQHLPVGTPMIVANSMPIRDVEYVTPPGNRAIRVYCNRGANGIDGTLSTALGVAHGAGRPAVLLTGDLALWHDANGFLLRPRFHGSLTIVVINNRGGGIFEHLPVAQCGEYFEDYFATPQEAEIGKLCAAHEVKHVAVREGRHFVSLITRLPDSGLRVLELSADRKRDAAWRRRWWAEISRRLA